MTSDTGWGGRREGAGAKQREPEGPGVPVKVRITGHMIERLAEVKLRSFVGNRLMEIAAPATRSDCMRHAMHLGLSIHTALIERKPEKLLGPLQTALEASNDIGRKGVREALQTLKDALRQR